MQLTKHIGCLLALVFATASAFAADWFSSPITGPASGSWLNTGVIPTWTVDTTPFVINDWSNGATFQADFAKDVKSSLDGADSKIVTKVTFTAIDGEGYTMKGNDFPQEMNDVLENPPKAGLTVVENPAETYSYWGIVGGAWVRLSGTDSNSPVSATISSPVTVSVSFYKEDDKAYVKYAVNDVLLAEPSEVEGDTVAVQSIQYLGKCDLYAGLTGLAWSNVSTNPEKITISGGKEIAFNHTELEKFLGSYADDNDAVKTFFETESKKNHLMGWVNYAIGNVEQNPIAVVSNKCETGGVVLDFGFNVATGHSVSYKEGDTALEGGKVAEQTGIHKVDVYVDGEKVASQDVGVMNTGKPVTDKQKTDDAIVFDIIAVPFNAFNGNVTVANLLNTAELTDGDTLHVPSGSGYNVWQWDATAGKWQAPVGAVKYGALLGAAAATAEQEVLTQGQAIWFEHNAKSKIVIAGTLGTDEEEQKLATGYTVKAGTKDEPNWELVANPSVKPLALSSIAGNDGDQIVLEDAAEPKQYQRVKNSETEEWQVWEKVISDPKEIRIGQNVITVCQTNVVLQSASSAVIPAGIGFWYVNTGAAVTIPFPANAD